MTQQDLNSAVAPIGVTGYEESPYANADWEVVGKQPGKQEFVPMQVENIFVESVTINPMFEDYGGVPVEQGDSRWHLPEGMDYESEEELSRQQAVEESKFVKLKPEELEEIKNQCFQEGKEQGMAESVESNLSKMESLETRLKELVQDVHQQVSEIESATAKSGVALVLEITRKIIGTAVDVNPEYIIDILAQAISKTGTSTIKKIRVSPDDMEFIDVLGVRKMLAEYDGSWEFEADTTVKSGCIVETSSGDIDFQLDEAWKRISDKVVTVTR